MVCLFASFLIVGSRTQQCDCGCVTFWEMCPLGSSVVLPILWK